MADDEQFLHVHLSSGYARTLALDEKDTPEAVIQEITDRENEYEWIATTEGTYVRVEAVDEIWIGPALERVGDGE